MILLHNMGIMELHTGQFIAGEGSSESKDVTFADTKSSYIEYSNGVSIG